MNENYKKNLKKRKKYKLQKMNENYKNKTKEKKIIKLRSHKKNDNKLSKFDLRFIFDSTFDSSSIREDNSEDS